MNYETLLCEINDGVATVTLNRTDQLNAFTVQMADDLVHFFEAANCNDDIKAIVVTGSGRAFCAGMDLSGDGNVFGLDERLEPTMEDLEQRLDAPEIQVGVRDTAGKVSLAIYRCTKPVIAAINGPAVGVGITMTLAMDFRLASETAKIGFVFGKLGIVPEGCSSWFLPRIVGISKALEWVYRADIFDAEEARCGGLVSDVFAPEDLLRAAQDMARSFVHSRSAVATALTRQMFYRNMAQADPFEAHKVESLAVFYTSRNDGKEGVQGFREKREPRFSAKVSSQMPPFYPW